MKQEFLQIFNDNIKGEGADKLLAWLEKSDFFNAPASTRFHSNYQGGLCEHSVKVYNRYKKLLQQEYGENLSSVITEESIAIIALLHDICKVNTYKTEYRNVKVDGVWTQQPYYNVEDD